MTRKRVDDAFKKSDASKNQRPIEEAISGSSGRPTKYEYDGMRTRKAKKRD